MDSRDVATFFALMLIGAAVAVVAAQFRPTWRAAMSESAPVLAAAVAASATAGSLYFSEVADFVPCQLCWYQRIAMYPLAVILPLALWRRDRAVGQYALVLGGIWLSERRASR